MANTKSYKKPNKSKSKRTVKKRSTHNRITGPLATGVVGDPFPKKMFCKLVYSDTQIITTGAIDFFGPEYVYSLNSLYDPLWSTGGHQPYGHDTLATMYKKYKVSGCLVELTYSDPSVDGTVVGALIQPPNETATISGNTIGKIKERPNSFTKPVANSGSQSAYIKSYVPIGKISGLTPLQFKSDLNTFSALYGADPVHIPKLRISAANTRGTAGTITVRVKLTYFCQSYDRITLPQS